MNIYIEKVAEFHENFGHPINDYKNLVDLETRKLRISLIFEELKELSQACDTNKHFNDLCEKTIDLNKNIIELSDGNNVDDVEVVDALGDLQYVLSGAVLALGHHNKFDDVFTEIHDSNMSKACANMVEVFKTLEYYNTLEQPVECYFTLRNDKYYIYRQSDNKILKNVCYKAADIKSIL